MRACKWHIVEFCSFDKIFRFAWHSISFVLSVSKKWLWLRCVCHCCCLYFQFSRSEVYSWYVLYSFRKLTDSRLDPIEDVFTPKHSYFLSVTQDFFFFLHVYSCHFALSLLLRFSLFIFHHFPFFCILSISKSVCVYFQNYFLFFRISIRSFFQVNIWV